MKSMLFISMLFTYWEQDLAAQDIKIQRSHAIAEISPQHNQQPATGTLNIVAIMVEFQPDDNRLTSGTGIFGEGGLPYLENQPDFKIEPLPHNQSYFESHLEFAKNYYEKASDNQLTIDYRVLPDVYRLPKKMEEYSPTGETFTNEKIAELSRDAWQQVEDNGGFDATGLDSETTAFVIFHAGIGRDIELTGTNLDITPYDIPSIYLRKDDIRDLTGDPSFDGFPVNNGTFRITNSMILPRTQSRRGLDIQDNEFVFPLSINGLVIASIGSHLGLPDLFNTETGDPAIGRFGLMDGAGFFSYNGLLPPEPSAWEKIYLGWENPTLIDANTTGDISLPAGSLNQPNSIAKVELSSSEYFLIENRHRDPDNSGITITIRKPDGSEVQQTFTNNDEEFVFQEADFDTLLEAGAFVNADNFDFSLPGGLDVGEDEEEGTEDDRYLNGGILIWHIDEAMIQSQLQAGRVNADRNRRGIDLEEADGAQDIGPGIPGAIDNSAAFGTAFDYWWSGNNYRVIAESGRETQLYQNRFGADTQPDNKSNSGAPSFFELYDFSDNLPEATFRIQSIEPSEDIFTSKFSVQLDSSLNYFTTKDFYYDYYPLSLSVYETATDTFLIVPANGSVIAVDISEPENHYQITNYSVQQPFIGDELILAEKPGTDEEIQISSFSWDSNTSDFTTNWTNTLPRNKGFISSQNGDTLHADFTTEGILSENGNSITLGTLPFQRSEIVNSAYSTALESIVVFSGNSAPEDFIPENQTNRLFTGLLHLGNRFLFYVFEENRFSIIDPQEDSPVVLFEETEAEWPAILDDASILRVDKTGNQIVGENRLGGITDFTPIPAPDGVRFIGTPLYADLLNSGNSYAALVVGQDSLSKNIYAYDSEGNPVEGFPLYVGRAISSTTQPIHPIIFDGTLYAVSHKGTVKAWNLTQVTDAKWSSRYGNTIFNKVTARVSETSPDTNLSFGILNDTETYNWPNPANEVTNIRFEIAPPGGTVEVRIITMSGRILFEKKVQSSGGFPQEIQVETSNWGSGGYVALIKATVDGATETKLVKIGVVH
ncbi:MAG: hypothetical protein WD158_03745 [Balneolaceae bacterium]